MRYHSAIEVIEVQKYRSAAMYVCLCNSVTDRQIRKACENGANSITCLQNELKVGTCCGRCKDCAREIIHETLGNQVSYVNAVAG